MEAEAAAATAALQASAEPSASPRTPGRRKGSKDDVLAAWQKATWDHILTYVDETIEDPALKVTLRELRNSYLPEEERLVDEAPQLPVYPPDLPSPIVFTEIPGKNGEATLEIAVASLPHPTPYYARSKIPDRVAWTITEYPDRRLLIRVPVSAHPSKAREERGQAYTWAARLCLDLTAPLPTGINITDPAIAPPP